MRAKLEPAAEHALRGTRLMLAQGIADSIGWWPDYVELSSQVEGSDFIGGRGPSGTCASQQETRARKP